MYRIVADVSTGEVAQVPLTVEEEAVWAENRAIEEANALPNAKIAKNADINQWREDANLTSFPHLGKVVSCDNLSRSDIDGVAGNIALFGTFPAGFPGAWKATDNSYIMMPTIQEFKDMYASMTAQGSENFAHSQSLKTALAAATTQAEIDAIVW